MVTIAAGELPQPLTAVLADLPSALQAGSLYAIKIAPAGTACVDFELTNSRWKRGVFLTAEHVGPFALKLVRHRDPLRRLVQRVTKPTLTAFRQHKALLDHGVPTVAVYAAGTAQYVGGVSLEFLVMESLEKYVSLEQLLNELDEDKQESDSKREQLLRYFAKQLGIVHGQTFFHKDIKPYHCYLPRDENAGWDTSNTPWLWIDLDRCAIGRTLSLQQRVANLYQLYRYFIAPRFADSLAEFIEHYLEASAYVIPAKELQAKVEQRFLQRSKRSKARHP